MHQLPPSLDHFIGPNHLVQIRGHPVFFLKDVALILQDIQQDSTGCPLEFCKFASKVLELPISSRNAIKNSTGCPVEILLDVLQNLRDVQQNCSTGRPLQQKIWRDKSLNFALKNSSSSLGSDPSLKKIDCVGTRQEPNADAAYSSLDFTPWDCAGFCGLTMSITCTKGKNKTVAAIHILGNSTKIVKARITPQHLSILNQSGAFLQFFNEK